MSTRFRSALGAGAMLFVFALVLELSLRAFGPWLPGSYRTGPEIEPDEELGWRNIAGAVTWVHRPDFVTRSDVNGEGRFGPLLEPRSAGRCRVLLLGDSYIAAEHVPYASSIAARLPELLGTEVVNGAVSGYGTDQELLLFERDASALHPDIAVVFVTVANDVWNNDWQLESRLPTREKPHFDLTPADQLMPAAGATVSVGDRARSLVARSFLASVLKSALFDPLAGAGVRRQQLDVLAEPRGEWSRAWRITELLVARFAQESRRVGVPLVLVAIPDPCQVYQDACAGREELAASDVPQRRLASAAAGADLPFVDLLAPSRTSRDSARLYHQHDIHWDVAGHELAAHTVADALRPRLGGGTTCGR